LAPVAISALPNATSCFVDSFAVRASGSSFITLVRVATSTPFSSAQPSSSQ
jgi:hypothetical protein